MSKASEAQAKREQDMPMPYRANYRKAIAGKSKSAAIKAMCLECFHWQRAEIPDTRARVQEGLLRHESGLF